MVKAEYPRAIASFDLSIGGDLWEMKNAANSNSSVSNQVKRARVEWMKFGGRDRMRVVVATEGCEEEVEAVVAVVDARLRGGERAMVLSQRGAAVHPW